MNRTEKMAFEIAMKKIRDMAVGLGFCRGEISVIYKVALIRNGRIPESPLHAAELTLKELISLGSHGEVAPGDIEINLTGAAEFLASDEEYLEKVRKEIDAILEEIDV